MIACGQGYQPGVANPQTEAWPQNENKKERLPQVSKYTRSQPNPPSVAQLSSIVAPPCLCTIGTIVRPMLATQLRTIVRLYFDRSQ
jgi:hypothetical protein